jgi:hypothetical protein
MMTQCSKGSSNVDSLRRNVELKTTKKHELECFLAGSSRKSKIYDDGIVVMQCASHRVATSHKFSLTIIFSFLFTIRIMFRCRRHITLHNIFNKFNFLCRTTSSCC